MQPAIRHAARGFAVTPYLSDCIKDAGADLSRDKLAAALPPARWHAAEGRRAAGAGDYAEALTLVSQQGEKALHGGPLGDLLVECMEKTGGFVRRDDLTGYKVEERAPIRGRYRGWEILGPPPPAASGVHITQMLNILEGYDIAKMGFGTVDTLHLLAEVLKIAFADRAEASGDPDFVKVPVERIVSRELRRRSARRLRHRPRHAAGRAACRRRKAPTPPISPWPTARATSSARRRPSTACSARASSCPAPA